MEPFFISLTEEDFSLPKKIVLVIFGLILLSLGGWDLFGGLFFKADESVQLWLPVLLLLLGLMFFYIAFHNQLRRRQHFVRMDDEKIDYLFGFFGQSEGSIRWENIQIVLINKLKKTITLHESDHSFTTLNMYWLNRSKVALIKRDLVTRARAKGIKVSAS